MFEIEFPDTGPSVCIAIPTRNEVNLLATCIESLALTTYRNYEILVVDNESDDVETLSYLAALMLHPRCRIVRIANDEGKFFAGLMNRALDDITADYVLLLNNDTKLINPRWLSQMVGYMQMEGVGSVGARLFFPDETVQHAGIVHGYHGGLPGHAFRGKPRHDWGYMGFMRAAREYSAVTAACMMVRRDVFDEIGGFDEELRVAFNDVDFCLRAREKGFRIAWTPYEELFHHESATRGYALDTKEVEFMKRRWGAALLHDPYYNPNLTLDNENFSIRL